MVVPLAVTLAGFHVLSAVTSCGLINEFTVRAGKLRENGGCGEITLFTAHDVQGPMDTVCV